LKLVKERNITVKIDDDLFLLKGIIDNIEGFKQLVSITVLDNIYNLNDLIKVKIEKIVEISNLIYLGLKILIKEGMNEYIIKVLDYPGIEFK
jgi:hypothetical protein